MSSILWKSLAVDNKIKEINTTWQIHNDHVFQKTKALHNIHKHFGYGGFIHHFKNLVLRSDERYIKLSEKAIVQTLNSIEIYKSLVNDQQELIALQKLETVVNKYNEKFQVAKQHFKSGIMQIDMDELVKVDDAPAFEALASLSSLLAKTSKIVEQSVNKALAETQFILNTSVLIFIPLNLIAALIIIIYLRKMTASFIENESIFLSSPDALIVCFPSGKIIKTNLSAQLMFGYSEKEFKELTIEELLPEQYRERHCQYRKKFSQTIQSRQMGVRPPFPALRKDGSAFQTSITITTFGLEKNIFTMAVVRDITNEISLKEASATDYLTKLPNRFAIDKALIDEIERARRYKRCFSIMLSDIDEFKQVNDVFGHQKGDEVLSQFAEFLNHRKRSTDFIGRWGGEEFVVICPETSIHDTAILGENLRSAVEEHLFSEEPKITISIGIATFNIEDIGESEKTLLHRADVALYKAKEDGRNCIKVEE
ncbi:MAG: hypothetical protein DHS20C13_28680 [Thermodesulfobacteriota bacterium]|nr:MAG: hypothetical protein DHS20C13_28680 [Thermodesulfobacteriota bacterium]